MSIIIHFNTASFIPSSTLSTPSCVSRGRTKLAMVPGIDETDQTVMTDDESSMVDIATSNTLYTHTVNDLKNNHVLGSCFGLPYQDHNYGAPPPPTPPSYSPCTSPAHANGVPDEDTNLSIVSTSTINEETQEGSITRCICGFEHDDEYMICCDLCLVWQHVDCMGLDRNNIPETYLCEKCEPRKVDRHKAKVLQTRKKVAMTDSSDSDEDSGIKNTERKHKNRKRKRREEEKNEEKSEQGLGKRSRQMLKHTKEKIEAKRSKLRRTKNKESTSTADEEAQDAWEISLEWCEKNFETAVNNQYTPEIQKLVKTLPMLGHEERFMELLLTRNCQVIEENHKKLISVYDIPRDQPLIEYKGKFLLASQFYDLHPAFSKRLFPFVMFYTLDQEEICIDASVYGNEARFIRRSCKPNAELRHLVYHGNVHLYISSTKAVFKDDEITLPLEFTLKESIKDIECACESEECILKFHPKNGNVDMSQDKKKKGRKLTFSADDDSSHSFAGVNASPTKCRPIRSHSQTSETTEGKSDHETEEQANERKKKTREERKIDAIMRAFDQMEKAAKRRQQALERQKAHHPRLEEVSEKLESMSVSKEDDKVTTASGSETQGGEDDKSCIQTPKPKKGKRRRGSGTPSRRRTRTNSGGSDILSPEETVLAKNVPVTNIDIVSSSDTIVETVTVTSSSCSASAVLSPVLSSLPTSPVVLKTKRFLLHEWLQEKSETNTNPSTTSPVSIRTEVKWNTSAASSTCYVQCTKDNPHSGGISAAHLRRSSTSSQIKSIPLKSCTEQGFTKKRWLRQAMFDCSSYDEPLSIDPGGIEGLHLDNDCFSPTCHGEMGSPGAVDDTVTPLKKRRLMRESLEFISSPLSPSMQNSECSNTAISFTSIQVKTEDGLEDSDQQLVKTECLDSKLSPTSKEDASFKINGLSVEHSESSRKIGVKEVNENIKEESSNCETSVCIPLSPKCQVSETVNSTLSSNCKGLESSMQNNCDFESKACDSLKSGFVLENNFDLTQSTFNDNKPSASNADISSDLHSNGKVKSNSETEKSSSVDKSFKNLQFESTSECSSVKPKIPISDNCKFQSSIVEDKYSSSLKSDSFQMTNGSTACPSDTKEVLSSETKVEQTLPKFQKLFDDDICNAVNENSLVQPITCESTKDNSSDLISLSPEAKSSASPVKNADASVSVSFDYQNEQIDSGVDFHKKLLSDLSTADSEVLCCNSFQPDGINVNHINSDLDSKSSQLSNESSGLIKTTSASATQKRKVSLSEYRLRMKDGSNKRTSSDSVKKSTSSPATAIPETLPEQVTLAPLPLFDTAVGSKSPPETSISLKNLKKKAEVKSEEESYSDVAEHRENLTERLKREFGFEDDSEASTLSQTMSLTGSTSTVVLCAQPPPPPPPPPPRPIRSSQTNISGITAASPSQFGFSLSTPYARPSSYIIPQVPSAHFIPVQQTVNTPVMPSIHPITAPGVQCSVRTTLLPSPHSFAPSLSGTVLQSSIQHEFSSVNAQNFAALVQQPPPPPPPPKSYPHVYQSGLYK